MLASLPPRKTSGQPEETLLQRLEHLRGLFRPQTSGGRALAAVVAFSLFGAGAFFAVSSLRLDMDDLMWPWLVGAALAGVPVGVALNVLELLLAARVAGRDLSVPAACRVTLLASAANLLPLPGGVLVRVNELAGGEGGLRGAVGGTGFMGLVWVGTTCVLAAAVLLLERAFVASGVLAALGVAAAAAGVGLAARELRSRPLVKLVAAAIAVELVFATVFGVRMWACARAIGSPATVQQGIVLGVSAALASVVGIFPGGLGLGEALAALLGPLTGLPASVSFLAAGLNRLIGIVVQAPMTLFVLSSSGGGQRRKGPPEDHEGSVAR